MKKTHFFFLFLLFGVTLLSSCSKYEEGSDFTLLSKKSRMTNDWKLTSLTVNGAESYDGSYVYELSLKSDGTGTLTVGASTSAGTWAFSSDKEDLIITDSDGQISTYEIVQLKSDDLKLRQSVEFFGYQVETLYTFTSK